MITEYDSEATMSALERDVLHNLKAVQASSIRNLRANDMTAYRVLACEEARLMDALRVIWKDRAEIGTEDEHGNFVELDKWEIGK